MTKITIPLSIKSLLYIPSLRTRFGLTIARLRMTATRPNILGWVTVVLSLQRLCKKVLREKGIKTQFIELEKPWQNGDSEVFHGILRDDSQNKWRFLWPYEGKTGSGWLDPVQMWAMKTGLIVPWCINDPSVWGSVELRTRRGTSSKNRNP